MRTNFCELKLSYLKYVSIRYKSIGLEEPSGVALTKEKDALWVVSDDKKRIFQVDFDGALRPEFTIKTKKKELEGITLDDHGTLYTISEAKNEIIVFDADGTFKKQKKLKDIEGYCAVSEYFKGGSENKGLEGIAWGSRSLFVLKESDPGLLIEISKDLKTICNHRILNTGNGFENSNTDSCELDYSDICYDPLRQLFWILSDKAKCVFLYSWEKDQVVTHFPLTYKDKKGKQKKVKQAEGVTYNPDDQCLYIVSDKEARLYVFEVSTP